MQIKGVYSDAVTYVCCLQACIHIDSIRRGQELHSEILQKGFEGNPKVGNTLVDMYAKYGYIAEAQRVFDTLSRKDVVTWTALMAGYNENRDMEQTLHYFDHVLLNGVALNVVSWNTLIECYADKGDLEKAIELYQQMQEQGLIPNEVTFSSIVRGCGNTSLAIQTGQKVHVQVLGVGKVEGSMGRALVDKFGSMIDAENVFNALQIKNCFAWTAFVMGYARKGEVKLLFESLEEMNRAGIEPDEVTFIGIITVCTHTGLLNVGQTYFEVMNSKFGISPNIEHYNCMVDLLSRSGKVPKAVALLEKLEIGPDFVMWNTMLGACRHTLGHSEVGRFAFELSVELNEEHSAAYALMLNTLMWEDA